MPNHRGTPPYLPQGPLCDGKVTHMTGASAWLNAKRVSRRRHKRSHQDEPQARPYKCPTCGLYHLGRE